MKFLLTIVILACFACTGASCQPKPTQAVNIHCPVECMNSCAPLTGWNGTRDPAQLTALMDAHDVEHKACDLQRQACADCLDTGVRAQAIKLQ